MAAVELVTSATLVTSVMFATSIISATFALPLIRAGRTAIGRTPIWPGVILGGIIFGPGLAGITACVGSTGLGDG
jgi:hypothetical protein